MSWYYANDGQQNGPVEDTVFEDLVRQAVIKPDTLVWREGMANWLPYSQVSLARPATPVHPLSAGSEQPAYSGGQNRFCTQCGQSYPESQLENIGGALVCPVCKPAYLTSMQGSYMHGVGQGAGMPGAGMSGAMAAGTAAMPGIMPQGRYRYGGFWMRFLARIIDGILLWIGQTVILLPLTLIFGLGARATDPAAAIASIGFAGLSLLVSIGLALGYEVYFLTSRGATPGKLALGLQVVQASNGQWLGTGLAVGRHFATYLSGMILLIGYIIAGFDSEKRALHDHICGTRVVYSR